MAVEPSISIMDSLLEKFKLEDPWVPPRSWDSLPSQSGVSPQPSSHPPAPLYATSTVSEPSLVRLAMNALQGVESSLISIEKLSEVFRYSSADRTSHRIPSLWTRCSSNVVLGNLLTSIGQSGCVIFLLRRFVNYFSNTDILGASEHFSLTNQAFSVSVGKVIDGYISGLNTLYASVQLRRLSKTNNGGCLTSIGDSEMTLLEVYLHTVELRTQIAALGNLCNVYHLTVDFPVSSLEDLRNKADSEFSVFPRSGALLSFLYAQLKVADPAHSALLKFLFLQSYEPYSDFIKSWIYDGYISDPYHEFVVEYVSNLSISASGDTGILSGSPLPTVGVRDGAAVPCFLEECLVPLCRTGQQLQVIMKLLELSNNVGTCDTHAEILPSLVGLSTEYPWFAFPLSFDKGTIETMAYVRSSYYQKMLEKSGNILPNFDFSFRQAVQSVSLRLANNLNHESSFVEDESLIPPLIVRRDQNVPDVIVDSEASSIMDKYPSAEDLLESSECSLSGSSEEADEAEELIFVSHNVDPSYLSSLDFSLSLSNDNSFKNLYQSEISCSGKDFPSKINWKSGYAASHSLEQTCLVSSEQKFFQTHETQVSSSDWDGNDTWLHSPDCGLELNMDYGLLNTETYVSGNALKVSASNTNQHPCLTRSSSKLKYDSTYFSMNPTRNRGSFYNSRTMIGERGHASFMDSHFDFTSVKDPLSTYAVSSAGNHGPTLRTKTSVINETPVSRDDTRKGIDIQGCNGVILENDAKLCNDGSSLHKKDIGEEHLLVRNTSGGSAWESLLGRSGNSVNGSVRDHRSLLVSGADMPLDFVIKKCVYKYLSKLTIRLLIEGFKLQEHLQSLRCYHFMELADWADLFIMSLWHRKWHVSEVDKRIPEIQGALELAVQRSSCEGDPNKDRLYVYWKGEGITHLSVSAMGIHSFDFLGLGYRIDWPVSIILTPTALEIYSEIFNFLIQVKLAVFSLSDAWATLKGYRLEQHKEEVCRISILTETRHKVNHFVSALQQYVQSQLSQVSWYRFLDSLNHKVKDMLDLESVHMSYLTESLHICFLSNETRPVAGIIQNILQCAMDFRSCLTGSILGAGFVDDKVTNKCSQVDISQCSHHKKCIHEEPGGFALNLSAVT
ncbi:hypothetical protein CASFOL_002947 [Castilleja foliolosa]|uniref:Gamma-tubulin complex component n=1 Tax=Castilleja foliolosa TaxID=1961234 RepID=A0ABD3EGF8_9LAMI